MRLRHIPEADDAILAHNKCIKNPEKYYSSWSNLFGNDNPIHIEIGMGKGHFIIEMARLHPDINFIGIERYSSVLYRATQKYDVLEEKPANLYFILCDAKDLTSFFAPGEVSVIYLNFSDPWPKKRYAKRRLTSPIFLSIYSKLLTSGSLIQFKTDNRGLFEYSLETFAKSPVFDLCCISFDLHNDEELSKGNVMTEYEEKFSALGNPIFMLVAKKY